MKYRNKPVTENGIRFASTAEWRRWKELLLMEQAGRISGLVLQPEFVIIPAWIDARGVKYRAIKYRADFAYDETGRGRVVEDVKGMKTAIYELKKRMMHQFLGIQIQEIKA